MTEKQKSLLRSNLVAFREDSNNNFHHGDCVGADAQAAEIAREVGYLIHGHPPDKDSQRAFFPSDILYEPKPYLERNKDIVLSSEMLIATPKEREEQKRGSGTWATIRFALKNPPRSVDVIYP